MLPLIWHNYMDPCMYGTSRFLKGKSSQMLHGAGIFTYIYPKNGPNVCKYSIHGASRHRAAHFKSIELASTSQTAAGYGIGSHPKLSHMGNRLRQGYNSAGWSAALYLILDKAIFTYIYIHVSILVCRKS